MRSVTPIEARRRHDALDGAPATPKATISGQCHR